MSEYKNIDAHIDEAKRLGEEVADAYNDGMLNNLQKADAKVVKAFKTRYEAINYQREFGLISDEEYYKKLEQARDAYFSRNTQEWYKYTEEIYNYRKSAIEEYQKYVEDSLTDLIETVQKKQADYKGKLLDYAGSDTGFDTHTTYVDNYWPTGDPLVMVDYTLTDYEKEIEKLTAFNDAITKLKEKAADIDPDVFSMFFEQIRGMSVDDAKILTDLLLKASDEDFARHFELYDARNTLAENMAASYYSDDYSKLAEELKTGLEQEFSELPDDFFEYGSLVGESFIEGFMGQVEGLMVDLTVEAPTIQSGAEENNIENTTFSPVYYFYGDRATTSRTRLNAKNDALFSYMRGLE